MKKYIFCCLFFWQGCISTDQVAPIQTTFFELEAFIENEIVDKSANVKSYEKSIVLNGKAETKSIVELDLAKELNSFLSADLNRPVWLDQYQVDTLFTESFKQVKQLRYTALSNKLRTKLLTIDFENNQVNKIFVEQSSENQVANTKKMLTYIPTEGYRIEHQEDIIASDARTLVVDVKFVY